MPDTRKVNVKPFSAGSAVPLTVKLVRNAADIWAPIVPPTVRMTVFMPIATPVTCGETASTISLASIA